MPPQSNQIFDPEQTARTVNRDYLQKQYKMDPTGENLRNDLDEMKALTPDKQLQVLKALHNLTKDQPGGDEEDNAISKQFGIPAASFTKDSISFGAAPEKAPTDSTPAPRETARPAAPVAPGDTSVSAEAASNSSDSADPMKSMERSAIDKTLNSNEPLTNASLSILNNQIEDYIGRNPSAQESKQLEAEIKTKASQEINKNANFDAGLALMNLAKLVEYGR